MRSPSLPPVSTRGMFGIGFDHGVGHPMGFPIVMTLSASKKGKMRKLPGTSPRSPPAWAIAECTMALPSRATPTIIAVINFNAFANLDF